MASHEIRTSIDISATPERVWSLLTDFNQMPAWNPFFRSITGTLKPGSTLSIEVAPPGRKTMRFKPTMIGSYPHRELRWRGKVFMRGFLDSEHYFLLEPHDENGTHFVQGESFTGLLVTVLGGALAATENGFNLMNAALKKQAEQTDRAK